MRALLLGVGACVLICSASASSGHPADADDPYSCVVDDFRTASSADSFQCCSVNFESVADSNAGHCTAADSPTKCAELVTSSSSPVFCDNFAGGTFSAQADDGHGRRLGSNTRECTWFEYSSDTHQCCSHTADEELHASHRRRLSSSGIRTCDAGDNCNHRLLHPGFASIKKWMALCTHKEDAHAASHGHGHHESTSLFRLGDNLNAKYTIQSAAVLILFTILCEHGLHLLQDKVHGTPYHAMLHKVTSELTILGLIAFMCTLGISAGWISHGERYEAFEVAHIGIFFVALIYVVQSSVAVMKERSCSRRWNNFERLPKEALLAEIARVQEEGGDNFCCLCGDIFFRKKDNIPDSDMLRYRMIRTDFIKQVYPLLPQECKQSGGFSFSIYLQKMMQEQTIEQLELDLVSWGMALVSLGLMYIAFTSHEYGPTKNGRWIKLNEDDHRRLSSGSGASGYTVVDSGTEGAVWQGVRNTGSTVDTAFILGDVVLLLSFVLQYVAHIQVNQLLRSADLAIDFNEDGTVDEKSVWWIDSKDGVNPHGEDDAQNAVASPTSAGKEVLVRGKGEEGNAMKSGAFVDLKLPRSITPRAIRRALDFLTMFNCYFISFYFINIMMTAAIDQEQSTGEKIIETFLLPLSCLVSLFWVMPDVHKQYALLLSVTAFKSNEKMFREVLKYMAEEKDLVKTVQEKLKKLAESLPTDQHYADKIFDAIDEHKSGVVTTSKLKVTLQELGLTNTANHHLNTLLRVIDPDGCGTITREDFSHFMQYGHAAARKHDASPAACGGAPTPEAASAV